MKSTKKIISIDKLHAFENHPYKVQDNEEMEALAESIKEHGIVSPKQLRKRPSRKQLKRQQLKRQLSKKQLSKRQQRLKLFTKSKVLTLAQTSFRLL